MDGVGRAGAPWTLDSDRFSLPPGCASADRSSVWLPRRAIRIRDGGTLSSASSKLGTLSPSSPAVSISDSSAPVDRIAGDARCAETLRPNGCVL